MPELQFAANIALAVCIAISVHSLLEPMNIRKRVAALKAKLAGEEYTGELKLPVTLDAPWKSLMFGSVIMLVLGLIAYFIIKQVAPPPTTIAWVIAGILIVKEAINTLQVDAYHSEIGSVIDGLDE